MAIARYDPYTDSFVYEDSKTSINGTATISLESFPKNIIQRNVVELSDDSIDKIAEAVVRKLAEQTEPSLEQFRVGLEQTEPKLDPSLIEPKEQECVAVIGTEPKRRNCTLELFDDNGTPIPIVRGSR